MDFSGRRMRIRMKDDSAAVEQRGCLLNKFLDMRKRSLIRSGSQDSGLSFEAYEPLLSSSSFDAESFLEELGFGGANKPLIPDRFIPSLIHRVSAMPDEMMVKLDSRVWKSIDSFKKKEHMLWYSTYSSLECDLCFNDLQRSPFPLHSSEVSCDTDVQCWLSRFEDSPASTVESADAGTKTNMANIGNQSSTESGFASMLGEDEVFARMEGDNLNDFSTLYDCIDDSGFLTPQRKISKTFSGILGEERLHLDPDRTHSYHDLTPDKEVITTTTFVFSEQIGSSCQCQTLPSQSMSVWTASATKSSPSSQQEICSCTDNDNNNHSDEQTVSEKNDTEDPKEEVITMMKFEADTFSPMEVDSRKHSLKKMPTDGQLFLLLLDLDNAEKEVNCQVCLAKHYIACHCLPSSASIETGDKDSNSFQFPVSFSINNDMNDSEVPLPSPKKRHSFDAAFACTAAEKRKRFRQSHAKSHSFLFDRVDTPLTTSRVSEMVSSETTDDSYKLLDLREESPAKSSEIYRGLHSQKQSNYPEDVPYHDGAKTFDKFNTVSPRICSSILTERTDEQDSEPQDISGHNIASEHKTFAKFQTISSTTYSSSCNERPNEEDSGPQNTSGHSKTNELNPFDKLQTISSTICSSTCSGQQDISGHNRTSELNPFDKSETTYSLTCIERPKEKDSGPQHIFGHSKANELNLFDKSQTSSTKYSSACNERPSEQDNGSQDLSSHSGTNEFNPFYEFQPISSTTCPSTCNERPNEQISEPQDVCGHTRTTEHLTRYPTICNEFDRSEYHNESQDVSGENGNNEDISIDGSLAESSLEHFTALSTPQQSSDHANGPQEILDEDVSQKESPIRYRESCGEPIHFSELPDDSASVSSLSDSEFSEIYFSCDELLKENSSEQRCAFGNRDHSELEASVKCSTSFSSRLSNGKRLVSMETTSRKSLFENYCESRCLPNRTFTTTDKENILKEILKSTLRLSLLCDSQNLQKSEVYVKSLRDIAQTFGDGLPNPRTRLKSLIHSRRGDKTDDGDNDDLVSESVARNPSLLPQDMWAPKCEVKFMDYNDWGLFWASQNAMAETTSNCDSRLRGSKYPCSDLTNDRRSASGIRMALNAQGEIKDADNVYYSEIYLEIDGKKAAGNTQDEKSQKNAYYSKSQQGEKEKGQHEMLKATKPGTTTNTESPCRRALKDLEELRSAIQKAKETRISASRELRLLQELLQGGEGEDDVTSGRIPPAVEQPPYSFPDTADANENRRSHKPVKALSELQQQATKDPSHNNEFWEEEIRKAKEEVSQMCHEKLSIMEDKLRTTEEELSRTLKENERLKDRLELRDASTTVCKCGTETVNSDFAHMNGGISDDEKNMSTTVKQPPVPTKNFWQEWDRLQSDLTQAERKADELNVLLNQKLIELNKMQLTLSKQTKEMILLEKAYFQLRSHLSKRRHKSGSSHQSSSSLKESPEKDRTSETSFKASDPEIPP